MTSSPDVTLITPVLNGKREIGNCIKSIQEQVEVSVQHIIIDGKSTDGTQEYCRANLKPTDLLISEKDDGLYGAINKGLNHATGNIIGILNADDRLAQKDTLKKIVRTIEDRKADGAYGDLEFLPSKSMIKRVWKSESYSERLLRLGWMPPHPTIYLTKKAIGRIGLYSTEFRIASDYEYIWRLFSDKSFALVHIPEVLVKMKAGGMSNGSLRSFCKKIVEDRNILIRHNDKKWLKVLILKRLRKIAQLSINTQSVRG